MPHNENAFDIKPVREAGAHYLSPVLSVPVYFVCMLMFISQKRSDSGMAARFEKQRQTSWTNIND